MTPPSAFQPRALEILPYTPERAHHFGEINTVWLQEMFTLEEIDKQILGNPQAHIIDPGGDILFVSHKSHG
ncbi:MAG: MarR family transcriptional regulator, partial [Pseudomonadota bacterium]